MSAPASSLSLRSGMWSCSELAKGAEMAASLAGLSLRGDPSTMSRDQLLQALQDYISLQLLAYVRVNFFFTLMYIAQEAKAVMKNPQKVS